MNPSVDSGSAAGASGTTAQQLAGAGEKRPLKIPVARLGIWDHPVYGKVVFSQKDFDDIVRNFREDEIGFEPYLRYGHSRYPGAADGEPGTAFAHDLVQESDVLYGIFDPVTDEVVREIQTGQYRYSSAEITRNAQGKKPGRGPIGTVLSAVALTNAPYIPGLPRNQVLSNSPVDTTFFVVDMPVVQQEEHLMSTRGAGLDRSEVSFLKKLVQFFSGGALAVPGVRDVTSPERDGPMDKLQVLANRMKREQAEDDQAYANRMVEYCTNAAAVYFSAGKSEDEFFSDWQSFANRLANLGEEYSEAATYAMGLTASPFTSTPVYVNGKLVKGQPNQDNTGGSAPSTDHMVATAENYDPSGAPPTSGGNPDVGVGTLSPTAQSYQEGYSDNGSSRAAGRELPPYNPAGPIGYLVEALSQSIEYFSTLTGEQRGNLESGQFAVPGKEKLPINDAAHVRNAVARFDQTKGLTPDERARAKSRIRAAATKFGVKVSEEFSQAGTVSPKTATQALQEEVTTMPDTPVNSELQGLQAEVAALSQKFSEALTKLDNLNTRNQELENELASTKTQLTATAESAQVLSQEAAQAKLNNRANLVKGKGIPPALVDAAVEMVNQGGQNMRLSMSGTEISLEDALFGLLDKIPSEQRVNFAQVGTRQVFSATDVEENADPYDPIMKERMGQ